MRKINSSTDLPGADDPTPADEANSIEAKGSALAIACTLGPRDLQERLADIRDLASRALRRNRREGSVLRLTYDPEACVEVEDLVARESGCCAFLDFDIKRDRAGVHLTITAPVVVSDAAAELFAHFVPEPSEVRDG